MPDEYSRDEMLRALAKFRDRQFAAMLTVWIGVAAETHPEELRAAIGQVFSLAAVEESTRRIMAVLADAQAAAHAAASETRHLLDAISQDVDRLEQRIDAAAFEAERLGRPRLYRAEEGGHAEAAT
jgi:hypothetical protein